MPTTTNGGSRNRGGTDGNAGVHVRTTVQPVGFGRLASAPRRGLVSVLRRGGADMAVEYILVLLVQGNTRKSV